jgi:hypothetical protein
VATVFVDARNVLRSVWPNIPERELVGRCAAWAARNAHRCVLVFDGGAPAASPGCEVVGTGAESADDRLVALVAAEPGSWLVTSDRELRERVGSRAGRAIGGGAFARELLAGEHG